ncbi:MAG: hypothetical protein U0792_20955 [Gemmataceae bacterium]
MLASSYALTPAPTPQQASYTHAIGITISPRVIVWLPAVLLTIVFFSTFFRWTGSYLGGHPVYSQSPWQAVFASVSRNFAFVFMPAQGVARSGDLRLAPACSHFCWQSWQPRFWRGPTAWFTISHPG